MFRKASEKYVVLQDALPIEEQWAIERAVIHVMPAAKPPAHFVTRLREDLVAEARLQQAAQQERTGQALKLFGLLGGGLISVIGGLLVWLLVQRGSEKAPLVDTLRGPTPSDLSLSGA